MSVGNLAIFTLLLRTTHKYKETEKNDLPKISVCIFLRIPASKYEFVLRKFSYINKRSKLPCSFGNLKIKTYQLRFLLFYNCTNLQGEQIAVACRVLSSAKLKKSHKSALWIITISRQFWKGHWVWMARGSQLSDNFYRLVLTCKQDGAVQSTQLSQFLARSTNTFVGFFSSKFSEILCLRYLTLCKVLGYSIGSDISIGAS